MTMDEFQIGDIVRFRKDWKAICQKNGWHTSYPDWRDYWMDSKVRRKATIRETGCESNGDGLHYSIIWSGLKNRSRVREGMLELVSPREVTAINNTLGEIMKRARERGEV